MAKINGSSTSKISECSVRGWKPKNDTALGAMRMNDTEFVISHEDCRKLCKNHSKCISYVWSNSNGTGIYAGCRYSEVELNVSNVERTYETVWVGLKNGNDINFISTSFVLNKKDYLTFFIKIII